MNSEKIEDFWDLTVWQRSNDSTLEIYKIVKNFPQEELFGLTSQLRRASSSIGANIAEAFGRYGFQDKIRFYHIARGSAAEVQNFLMLAKGLGYITDEQFLKCQQDLVAIIKMLNGMIANNTKKSKEKS